jgi:hypothetical protein
VVDRNAQAGHLRGDFSDVVVVVGADAELDQAPGRGMDDLELFTAVTGPERVVPQGFEAELLVVRGRFGHVRNTHHHAGQTMQ